MKTYLFSLCFFLSSQAFSKPTILFEPIENVEIDLPDGSVRNLGEDLFARLRTKFQEKNLFLFLTHEDLYRPKIIKSLDRSEEVWLGSVTPAAKVRIVIDGFLFQTGTKGSRMSYGFDEFQKDQLPNEYPLKKVLLEPNWFDRTFDAKGSGLQASDTGLDLGEGLEIDMFFAFMKLKYERFKVKLKVRIIVESEQSQFSIVKPLEVEGSGFHYDITAGYGLYSVGIGLARKDAFLKAFLRAVDGTVKSVEDTLQTIKHVAKVDHYFPEENKVYLGSGFRSEVSPGVLYENQQGACLIRIQNSVSSGSIAEVLSYEDENCFLKGTEFVEKKEQSLRVAILDSSVKKESLAEERYTASSELSQYSSENKLSTIAVNLLFALQDLPYRISRYESYDQAYRTNPDSMSAKKPLARTLEQKIKYSSTSEYWAKHIAWDGKKVFAKKAPVIAVIDTGVDYNHPWIHDSIWKNSNPFGSPVGYEQKEKDLYGWDFISGDSRSYDDHYHGTELASMILTLSPESKIMPLKVFNPHGITSSSALFQAFQYAVEHGADVILCAWGTRKARLGLDEQNAIYRGVEVAEKNQILVITSSGDRGSDLASEPVWPALFSKKFSNPITVASLDENQKLVKVLGKQSNYSKEYVSLAAPGKDILVANPRGGEARTTSSGIAAAMVAGAVSRLVSSEDRALSREEVLRYLTVKDPTLQEHVEEGRKLQLFR